MKFGWRKIRNLMWLMLLCAGFAAGCPHRAAAEEMLMAEEAVFTDTSGDALAQAYSLSVYSRRSVSTGWSYGSQLTQANEIAMYEALASVEDMRAYDYSDKKGIAVTLPEPYVVELDESKDYSKSDPAYVQFLKDYAKATHAYVRDFGESYWITSFVAGFGCTISDTSMEILSVTLYPKDYYDDIREELGLTDTALETALRCADGDGSTYEKVKAAHDYVLELMDYNYANIEAAYGHTITGGLLEKYSHLGVCECYAKLFRLICEANDIPCILVTGGSSYNTDGSINANHMWNYVQMDDGNWYLADLTWDDTGSDPMKYFLLGSDTTSSNHMAVGVFGTVTTEAGNVSYDAFSVPTLAASAYQNIELESITLAESEITLEVESEGAVTVSGYSPEGADVSGGYLYTSSDSSVVSVDSKGVLTAKEAGSAVITVAAAGNTSVTAKCAVTVREHVFILAEKKEATCTEDGMQTYQCTNEGCEKTKTEIIEATGHSYGEWAVTEEVTCTEPGLRERICSVCGGKETEEIPAAGHSYGEWEVTEEATCTEPGLQERTCSVCGGKETEEIPAAGHTYGEWEVTEEATCTEPGLRERVCSVCRAKDEETQAIPVIEHTYGEWEVTEEATCTEPGLQERTCSVCGGKETEEIPAAGHTYGEWVTTKAATCTESGTQVRTCSKCQNQESQTIAATGHTPGAWTTVSEATVLAAGLQEQRCSKCNQVLATQEIAQKTAKVTLNATSVSLQLKKSTTALAIKSFTPGDSVKSWTSSNTKVATVNKSTGKITAKKVGTAKITVTMKSGATATCKIKVQRAAVKTTKITVSKKAVKLSKGGAYTIMVTRAPITTSDKLTFSSSNKKVATVNAKGKITAKKKGTAKITVKSGAKKVTVKVTVK